jgi:hypothetical protein
MVSDRIICKRCDGEFDCSPSREGECWCAEEAYRLPLPLLPETGGVTSCLCPSCLRQATSAFIAAPTGSES